MKTISNRALFRALCKQSFLYVIFFLYTIEAAILFCDLRSSSERLIGPLDLRTTSKYL